MMDVCGGGRDTFGWTPGTIPLAAGARRRRRAWQASKAHQAGKKSRSAGAAAYPEVNGLFEEIEVALGVDADGALAGARLHHMVRVEQLAVDEARAIVLHGLRSALRKLCAQEKGQVPRAVAVWPCVAHFPHPPSLFGDAPFHQRVSVCVYE